MKRKRLYKTRDLQKKACATQQQDLYFPMEVWLMVFLSLIVDDRENWKRSYYRFSLVCRGFRNVTSVWIHQKARDFIHLYFFPNFDMLKQFRSIHIRPTIATPCCLTLVSGSCDRLIGDFYSSEQPEYITEDNFEGIVEIFAHIITVSPKFHSLFDGQHHNPLHRIIWTFNQCYLSFEVDFVYFVSKPPPPNFQKFIAMVMQLSIKCASERFDAGVMLLPRTSSNHPPNMFRNMMDLVLLITSETCFLPLAFADHRCNYDETIVSVMCTLFQDVVDNLRLPNTCLKDYLQTKEKERRVCFNNITSFIAEYKKTKKMPEESTIEEFYFITDLCKPLLFYLQ